MKRQILFGISVALFASCSNEVLIDEIVEKDQLIEFETYSPTMTKAVTGIDDTQADNSGSTKKWALETHHETFKIWGYKTVSGTESSVFLAEQEVTAVKSGDPLSLTGDWTYSPARYWDKSASKYSFYAAAPYDAKWTINSSKEVKYEDFSLEGKTLAVARVQKNKVDANASFKGSGDIDLMLAHDVPEYTAYGTKVNLQFDHILSRFNIGVAQAKIDEQIYLNSVTLVNHKSNGTFNESLATPSTAGSIARWATTPSTQAKYTTGVGYSKGSNVDGLELKKIAGATSAETDEYDYVYQGLIIPQEMAYDGTVTLDGQYGAAPKDLDADAAPYLKIVYTIKYADEVMYAEGDDIPSGKNIGDVKTTVQYETFTYYYNIASMFDKKDADDNPMAVTFYEGFQNNLNILISPSKIEVDAMVYEWDTKEMSDYTVPQN